MPEGLDELLSRASDEQITQDEASDAAASSEPLIAELMSHREVDELAEDAAMPSPNELVADSVSEAEVEAESEVEVSGLVDEMRREQSLAEIAEAAESFVAEQCGEAPAAAPETHAQLEQFASASEAPEVLPVEPMSDLPPQSLASETPWETVSAGAKRYDVAEANAESEVLPMVEAAPIASVATSASAAPAPSVKPSLKPVENERRRKRRALIFRAASRALEELHRIERG